MDRDDVDELVRRVLDESGLGKPVPHVSPEIAELLTDLIVALRSCVADEFAHAIVVLDLLTAAGFKWELPGYYSLRAGDVELTLEPQVRNAGAFRLGFYAERRPLLRGEVLVDVKPRPRG